MQFFYERNHSATSRYGKKGSAVKISDAKRELKARFALTQQQVMSNLTYLIDRGWIKTVDIEKTVLVKGGTIPSTVTWYEITAAGIDKIDGDSEFQATDPYPGINISATGSNIITLGDGNWVNADYKQLHNELSQLKTMISSSDRLTDAQKLDIAADIESMKDQLSKPVPNKPLIKQLWECVENAVTAAGFVDYATKIGPFIASLLS